jgi:hypothetical protein
VTIWDAPPVRFARLTDSGTTVAFDAAAGTGLLAAAALRRASDSREVVHRQLIQRTLEQLGFVVLHGAGVSWHGRSVVLLGPSGAGKTTLQMDMASELGALLLGGGRVYCRADGQSLPYVGRFGIGTELAENRPRLRSLLALGRSGRKIALSSLDVARLLGSRLAGDATLEGFLFPAFHDGESRIHCSRPLTPGETLSLLEQHCLTPDDPKWPRWLTDADPRGRHRASSTLQALASRVPGRRLTFPRTSGPLPANELLQLLPT